MPDARSLGLCGCLVLVLLVTACTFDAGGLTRTTVPDQPAPLDQGPTVQPDLSQTSADMATDGISDLGEGADLTLIADTWVCPPECINSCAGEVCALDCTNGCTCPVGMDCTTSCVGFTDCSGPIDCSQGADCTIDCSGGACGNTITCGSGACTVSCDTACAGTIDCGDASSCSVQCGSLACTAPVICREGSCDISCGGGSCNGGVVCGPNTTQCKIDCTAAGACALGDVSCGSAACCILCGYLSCGGSLSCNAATQCAIDCPHLGCDLSCPASCSSGCEPGDGCGVCW